MGQTYTPPQTTPHKSLSILVEVESTTPSERKLAFNSLLASVIWSLTAFRLESGPTNDLSSCATSEDPSFVGQPIRFTADVSRTKPSSPGTCTPIWSVVRLVRADLTCCQYHLFHNWTSLHNAYFLSLLLEHWRGIILDFDYSISWCAFFMTALFLSLAEPRNSSTIWGKSSKSWSVLE